MDDRRAAGGMPVAGVALADGLHAETVALARRQPRHHGRGVVAAGHPDPLPRLRRLVEHLHAISHLERRVVQPVEAHRAAAPHVGFEARRRGQPTRVERHVEPIGAKDAVGRRMHDAERVLSGREGPADRLADGARAAGGVGDLHQRRVGPAGQRAGQLQRRRFAKGEVISLVGLNAGEVAVELSRLPRQNLPQRQRRSRLLNRRQSRPISPRRQQLPPLPHPRTEQPPRFEGVHGRIAARPSPSMSLPAHFTPPSIRIPRNMVR